MLPSSHTDIEAPPRRRGGPYHLLLRWARYPRPNARFTRCELLVYRLFYHVWNKHFRDYPDLRHDFIAGMQHEDEERSHPKGKLTLVSGRAPGNTEHDA